MNKKERKTIEYKLDDMMIKITIFYYYDERFNKMIYMAKSNYKNIFSIGMTKEETIKKCIDEVRLKKDVLDGNVKLLTQEEGLNLAKNEFENYFLNRKINTIIARGLSYSWMTECDKLIIEIKYSDVSSIEDSTEMNNYPKLMATIVVDLVTQNCKIIESKDIMW